MARYEHLPIYKAALDAAVHFEKVVAGFSCYHKYTLGTELRHASRQVVEQVIHANAARDRLPELMRLRDGVERLLVLMRLAKEVRAFKSFQAYQHAVELVVSVSRQNEGWIKSVAGEVPAGNVQEGQNRRARRGDPVAGERAEQHHCAPVPPGGSL